MKINNILFSILVLIGVLSCKKDEPVIIQAHSSFNFPSEIAYVDSVIQFGNYSDSINVTYEWNFGDGTISNEKAPTHTYINPGEYIISLTTLVDGVKIETSTKNILILIGIKYYDYLMWAEGFDFAECEDSSILLLGHTIDDWGAEYTFFLSKFDRNLRRKWTTYFDSELHPSFKSIERLSDGNFILAGMSDNSGNIEQFAITKIDSLGNIIWTKRYPQTNGYCRYATESSDGNIITIGTEIYEHSSGNTIYRVTVLKVDGDGNYIWKKEFKDEWLMESDKIVPMPDGYVFAASTGDRSCTNCLDSLVLTKINFDGDKIWQTSAEWNSHTNGTIYTTLASNNNYIIAQHQRDSQYFIFNLDGQLINETHLGGYKRNYSICSTNEGGFVIGGSYDDAIDITGLEEHGNADWHRPFVNGYGTMVKQLLDGNLLFIGNSDSNPYPSSNTFMVKLNTDGEIQ